MNPFGQLLGQYVKAIYVQADDQSAICFDVGYRERVYIGTDADCCSETWFADIVGVQNLIDHEVRGIEVLSLPEPDDERTRQEYDQAYGVRLTTEKGYCDIVYRNSSNGYYGGIAEPMDRTVGDNKEWTRITEDWQA